MRTLNNISIEPNIAPGIDLLPIIGETAWHEVTVDPSIVEVSEEHFKQLSIDLKEYGKLKPKLKILEVAAYSHITGYLLASKLNAKVTLFDVSSATLRLGRDIANERGLPSGDVRRVAGDFHQLPFNDGEFDVVYISSALHHTWRWHYVLAELLRVTQTGGLLILENEPCRRELCFYRFRTNRCDNFTETEAWLDEHGLLRTVAEPYLGSRNEQLFGMTENQEIPLGDLLEQLIKNNELLFLKTTPQICMGTLENSLDDALSDKCAKSSLDNFAYLMQKYFDQAREKMMALDKCFNGILPDIENINSMIKKISDLINKSAYGQGKLMFAASQNTTNESIKHLSERMKPLFSKDAALQQDLDRSTLFGASVKIIVRKGRHSKANNTQANYPHQIDDGVELMFNQNLLKVMDPKNSMLPNMQRGNIDNIIQALGDDWNVTTNKDSVRVATPSVVNPVVLTPSLHGHVVVFARVYGVAGKQPWTLWLTIDGEKRANLLFENSISGLLVASVSNAIGPIQIRFETVYGHDSEQPHFNLSHIGAIMVPDHSQTN